MRFGKRRRAYSKAFRTILPAILTAGLVISCGSEVRFERSLARLDAALGRTLPYGSKSEAPAEGPVNPVPMGRDADSGLRRLLDAAADRAGSSSDWLRLLSRAFSAARATKDPETAARIADRARKAYPTYEDIALGACRAYLDAGRAEDALALFPAPLDPHIRATWFAEAFLEAYRTGGRATRAAGDVELLDLLSETTGRGEPLVDAALLRMGAGDVEGAASLLKRARSLGTELDPDLAWDVGALDSLLSDSESRGEGKALLRKADAALLLGEGDWAREYLLELILAAPRYAWKPYAALAELEEAGERRDLWYERMMELFPSEEEAVRAYAAHLARTGRDGKALAELEARLKRAAWRAKTAVLAAEIQGRLRPWEPVTTLALRVSNEFPDDAFAQRWALGRLAESERYSEAAEAYQQARARGVHPGSEWYFEALCRILEDRIPEAIAVVEKEGPAEKGWEAPFALGVLYARIENYRVSADRFRIAVSSAVDGEGRARALTELGKSLEAAGDRKGAREAWAAALSVRPDSAEALRLLTTKNE